MKETSEDILDLIDLYLDGWGSMVLVGQVKCLTKTIRTDIKKAIDPYRKEYLLKQKARMVAHHKNI